MSYKEQPKGNSVSVQAGDFNCTIESTTEPLPVLLESSVWLKEQFLNGKAKTKGGYLS